MIVQLKCGNTSLLFYKRFYGSIIGMRSLSETVVSIVRQVYRNGIHFSIIKVNGTLLNFKCVQFP